ncbi:unnamed protein product [Phyllotreta striolata]|uniref:Uncharacterized protein n=1 Tax=Phyllotreta striolata TaxID=444603 RepID=A0A9N9TT49_PHYSR|nr:unnamed protein product [Phyllotreta striolata]
MDRREDLKNWFHKMGYDVKKFPKNISNFCNNSNVFVWEQLMEYVRPLSEVENIKKQILVSQLSNKNLDELQRLKHSSKEVELYLRKKELQEQLTFMRYSISQKENLNSKLQEENKISRFTLQKMNLEIEDNEQREYMLREKMKLLNKDRQFAESILENLNVPTLVNSGDSNEIMHDLSELKKKLQTDIEELQLPANNDDTIWTINKLLLSSKKNSRYSSTLSIFNSNTKHRFTSNTKRRISKLPFDTNPNKVTKCLFPEKNPGVMNSTSNHDTISGFATPSVHLGMPNTNKSPLNESFIKQLTCLPTANEVKKFISKYNKEDIWNVIQTMNNNLHLNILFKLTRILLNLKVITTARKKN